MEARWEVMRLWAQSPYKWTRNPRELPSSFSHMRAQREDDPDQTPNLPPPWSRTPQPPEQLEIHFCCLESPSWWYYFITGAGQTDTYFPQFVVWIPLGLLPARILNQTESFLRENDRGFSSSNFFLKCLWNTACLVTAKRESHWVSHWCWLGLY